MDESERGRSRWDVVCIGGGVIGLMTAYELTRDGFSVGVLDRGPTGGEASWAGAGIISPPPDPSCCVTAMDRLRRRSYDRFPEIRQDLHAETGIDIEYDQSGALELILDEADAADLEDQRLVWDRQGVRYERIDAGQLRRIEPGVRLDAEAVYFPQACQVRNPRFLAALCRCLERRGAALMPRRPVVDIDRLDDDGVEIRLADGSKIIADRAVISAGAWTGKLLDQLGLGINVFPMKGEIIAFQSKRAMLKRIVHAGKRYLVPRRDGLLLVGSTEVPGFDKEVTPESAARLRQFACNIVPALENEPAVSMWAGLRPASELVGPIISPFPEWDRVWIASGHFRQGLQLSTGTGRLLADALFSKPSFADVTQFALDADRSRFATGFHS